MKTIQGKEPNFILIFQDTVTHSNTAAGDNGYIVHAQKFLIPYRKMDIFHVNSISTGQDTVTQKLSNTATSPIAVEVGLDFTWFYLL